MLFKLAHKLESRERSNISLKNYIFSLPNTYKQTISTNLLGVNNNHDYILQPTMTSFKLDIKKMTLYFNSDQNVGETLGEYAVK